MFLVGRLLAASLIIDAVIFERFGSISGVVFALPGLRRLPAGSPRLARFFDLDTGATRATPKFWIRTHRRQPWPTPGRPGRTRQPSERDLVRRRPVTR